MCTSASAPRPNTLAAAPGTRTQPTKDARGDKGWGALKPKQEPERPVEPARFRRSFTSASVKDARANCWHEGVSMVLSNSAYPPMNKRSTLRGRWGFAARDMPPAYGMQRSYSVPPGGLPPGLASQRP